MSDDVFERIMLGTLIAIGACMVVLVALTAYVIITEPTGCRSEASRMKILQDSELKSPVAGKGSTNRSRPESAGGTHRS